MNLIDRYTYRVFWSEEDQEFVGRCSEFPSLSWLDDTDTSALLGIKQIVAKAVAALEEDGAPVPEPLNSRKYSGKLNLRLPQDLHRSLAISATERGVSLNAHIVSQLGQ